MLNFTLASCMVHVIIKVKRGERLISNERYTLYDKVLISQNLQNILVHEYSVLLFNISSYMDDPTVLHFEYDSRAALPSVLGSPLPILACKREVPYI